MPLSWHNLNENNHGTMNYYKGQTMEIEQMEKILKLMRDNNVAGFEVGDFKVTFFSAEAPAIRVTEDGEPITDDQALDDDLGLEYGEV